MEERKSRPLIVNIALWVLGLLSLAVFANIAYLASVIYFSFWNVAALSLKVMWAIIYLWLFHSVYRRKTYGRYLTTLVLAFLWILVFRNLILFFLDEPGFVAEAGSGLIWFVGWSVNVLELVILLPVAVVFAVSKNVSNYFDYGKEDNELHLPPPPPTFGD